MERELDLLLSDYEPLDWGVQRSLTQRDEEALRALGCAVGASRGDPFAPQLPDTRDRLRDLKMIDRVNAMMQQRRALLRQGTAGLARVAAIDAEAHALLEEIWQRNPGDPDVAPMLAATSRRRGDAARAVEIMRAMVVLSPTSATLQLGLARDYLALDRPDDALRSIARARTRIPRSLRRSHRVLPRSRRPEGQSGLAATPCGSARRGLRCAPRRGTSAPSNDWTARARGPITRRFRAARSLRRAAARSGRIARRAARVQFRRVRCDRHTSPAPRGAVRPRLAGSRSVRAG